MALVFQTDISTTANLTAFNNNVIRFASDTSGALPLKADIAIGTQVETIYPSPDGSFYFNFKEYFAAIVVTNNLRDTAEVTLNPALASSYTAAGGSFYFVNIGISVLMDNTTTETASREVRILAGVQQLVNYKRYDRFTEGKCAVLLPNSPDTNVTHYVKYWEGYPLDVSFLEPDYDTETLGIIPIVNETTADGYSFRLKAKHTRLYLSDGRTDQTITNLLPLAGGRNVLAWETSESEVIRIVVDKVDDCKKGPYLKYFNAQGGWSYWKFPAYEQDTIALRNIGEIDTSGDNLADTFSQTSQIGINASQRMQVASGLLTPEEFAALSGILTSPKIYLFTGRPFARAEVSDWVEVRLATQRQVIKDYKNRPLEINLEIELPDYYTQTL
jgi:hypothetical protein